MLILVGKPNLHRTCQAAPAAKSGRARGRIADHLAVDHLPMLIQHEAQHHAYIASISKVVFGRWLCQYAAS